MNQNLIFYINKLSNLIVSQAVEYERNQRRNEKEERCFNNCVRRVRQKGCDVLLNHSPGPSIDDPCVTDYGGNWSPVTLLLDYGKELETEGSRKYNETLKNYIKTLEEKPYNCVNDLLKFLLLLKKPIGQVTSECFQSDLSQNESSFSSVGVNTSLFLNDDIPSEFMPKRVTGRDESWTKQYESKSIFPRSFGNSEKESLKTLFSSKVIPSRSITESAFQGFLNVRNYKSERSLFSFSGSECNNENLLLDSFVENPIHHKLPSIKFNSESFPFRTDSWGKSNEEMKGGYLPSQFDCGESWKKSSVIELKRSSNYAHSFSILYEKPPKSQLLEDRSNDSFIHSKSKADMKDKQPSHCSNSKDIILGLWEHEQSLIKEFRPELAAWFPALRMITISEFVEDVRYLFTGISNGTFVYDSEKKIFNMVYGTCLDDVTPESLYHFSKEFMEVGNCYVKLMSAIHECGKNDFNNCTTVSQVFWKSIFEYLEMHFSLVLDIPVTTNLMALKSCTRDLHEIIKTVSCICKVEEEEPLPKGGELLTYLLSVAERISKQNVINIVFGILQNCCSVYFMCILQKWMFHGLLDTESNEFFVEYHDQKSKTKTRSQYNSFCLINEKVPVFFKGFEESFYNCGKSIHLLKLFNVDDKFVQLLERGNYPLMKLCFSEETLKKLENEFKEYEQLVVKTCGPKITIKQINEEEKERERNFQEHVKEFKALLKNQEDEAQLKRLEEAKAMKEEQNKLLNEQRNAIEAEKERKKQEEERERLKLEAEIKKSEEERENLINKEKTSLKRYFNDAMEDLEKRRIVAEERKKFLMKIIENMDDNANEPDTDVEGNVLNTFDENSNTRIEENLDRKTESELTCQSHDGSTINFDENLNPCVEPENEELKKVPKIVKSVAFKTIASEEAQRNKCKVLKSEFGLADISEIKPVKSTPKEMTDLERNRQRVLQSEYNILLKKNTSVPYVELSKTKIASNSDPSISNGDVKLFNVIGLQRKPECMDLCTTDEPKIEELPEQNNSSESYLSFDLSENSLIESEKQNSTQEGSGVLNQKYQDALKLDTEIFRKKSSHRVSFWGIKKDDLDNLPCTNYLKFQRYLRKCALVALKVQERLANDALLKHILLGEKLLAHLNSLRAYFFLNDGEFGRSFTHNIFRSLSKCMEPVQFFERGNLSNIVNEALNYSIHNFEQNSQNLSFRIVKMPPFLNHASHDVLSPFELTYKVNWPLSLILTEKALSKYKMVFRFLLKLKRINWTLNENFLHLNWHFKNKKLKGNALMGSCHYHKIQIFRHAMTQMMVTLDDYIFSNGIQFPWLVFLKDLETTQNIDQLYQKHVKYIKEVLSRCFLTKNSESLLDCIHSLIELALKFHYTAKSSSLELVNGKYEHPKFTVLRATFSEFCSVIKTFLNTLKEKISTNEILRSHYVLIEKFDLKLT